jgi:hypothetical protein
LIEFSLNPVVAANHDLRSGFITADLMHNGYKTASVDIRAVPSTHRFNPAAFCRKLWSTGVIWVIENQCGADGIQ